MFEIFMCLLVLVGLVLVLSGKARVLVKGFFGLFITNVAKTPEGAAAVYNEAIEQAAKNRDDAKKIYRDYSGKLEVSKNNYADAISKLESAKSTCESLAKKGEYDKLDVYSAKLDELTMDVELYSKEITKYTPLVENAKALQETGEREYNKLVKEKNATVAELKMNKSTKEIYDRLENIGKNNHSTRMLESVREGLIESKEQAVGATSVYNNKTSTKIEKIENTTRSAKTNDYIESLKNKYQTK